MTAIPVKHRIACAGLKVEEHSLPWRLDGLRAKRANMPFSVRQQLKRGRRQFGKVKPWTRRPGVRLQLTPGVTSIRPTRGLAKPCVKRL